MINNTIDNIIEVENIREEIESRSSLTDEEFWEDMGEFLNNGYEVDEIEELRREFRIS